MEKIRGMTGKGALVAALLAWATAASATTYRWTDDRGGVHFTDSYNKIPATYREKATVEKETPPNILPASGGGTERIGTAPQAPKGEVTQPKKKSRAKAGARKKHKVADEGKERHHRRHDVVAPQVPVSPARRAQDKVEEQIRKDRQAIEDAQQPARRTQEQMEEQIRKAREGTMGH